MQAQKPPFFTWENAALPALLAALPALYFTSKFRWYLPLPEGWQTVTTVLFPIAQADFVFHEGGHPIIGLLFFGADFMVTAGGTLMQLAIPIALLWHFWRSNQRLELHARHSRSSQIRRRPRPTVVPGRHILDELHPRLAPLLRSS